MKTLKQFFFFSWNSNDLEEKTFQKLKHAFTIASILIHFDFDKKIWIETNASNYVMTNILFQKSLDDQLHLVAFMSKKISSTKCNYEIYDKELLIVVKTFKKWRSKCVDIFVKNFVKILTNHKNLKHFMIFKQLNKKQVKWIEFLFKFNFKIIYKSKSLNIKSNNLIRRSKNLLENVVDERKQYNHITLLKKKQLDSKVRNAIKFVSMLMNEFLKNVASLIVMIYDLSEKKLLENEKSMQNHFKLLLKRY